MIKDCKSFDIKTHKRLWKCLEIFFYIDIWLFSPKEYWIEFEKGYFIFKMPTNLPVNHQELGRMRFISLAVVIAFLCQLVGLIGPGWIVQSSFLLNLKIGIWFALVCLGDTVCEIVSMTQYKSTTDISKYWNINYVY